MPQHLLEGEVDNRDQIILDQQGRIRDLEQQNRRLEAELATTRAQNSRAIAGIRHQLEPWFKAMKALFGEMDAIASTDEPRAENPQANHPAWEMWKSKLGGIPARFIDAMLIGGPMTQTQLRIAVGCAQGSVAGAVCQLNKAGLIDKNGGRVSLKELP